MNDIETADDIRQFVTVFYDRVRQDEQLSPIFNQVAGVDWSEHVPRIVSFWAMILLSEDGYTGNPVQAHLLLGRKTPIQPAHFSRWLALFTQTIDELFAGSRTETAKIRAYSIATVLQTKLYEVGLLAV